MDRFFQWISTTPVAGVTLLVLVSLVVLVVVAIYLLAFLQGREIFLWPPKIGERPIHSKNDSESMPNVEDLVKETHSADSALPSLHLSSRPIAILEGVDGPVTGSIYILVTGHRNVTVGADSSCDLPINSSLLSRQHFRLRISLIERTEQAERAFRFELIDSGSTNGTFLNGKHVGAPTNINNGDLIEAGDCGIRIFILAKPWEEAVYHKDKRVSL